MNCIELMHVVATSQYLYHSFTLILKLTKHAIKLESKELLFEYICKTNIN